MANRFDIVPVRPDDERGKVVRVVLRTEARSTVVFAAGCEGCEVEGLDLPLAVLPEGYVKMRRLRLRLQAYAQRRSLVGTAQLNT